MINRIGLPTPDSILENDYTGRANLYKSKTPAEAPTSCRCSFCPPLTMAVLLAGVLLYNSIVGD